MQHLLPLFTIHGVPRCQNAGDSVVVLINHGYCVGYSQSHNQPVWVAYQVSNVKQGTDYSRFPYFTDDLRLDPKNRIGAKTFGNNYDLGHMAPNAAINKQFGKLSQMETFLMSNICPQKAGLNRGVWAKLEAAILEKYATIKSNGEHVWVIVGPILSNAPDKIARENGTFVSIPDAFYCILVRPNRYPYDAPGNADYIAFIFPQNVEQSAPLDARYLTTINTVEERTRINFFPDLTKTMETKIENSKATEVW